MRSANGRSAPLRALCFETCEDRIVLSGQPVAELCLGDYLLHRPAEVFEQIGPALADVNDQYGVTYVRNAYGFTGTGQTVAVIDTGVAYDHQSLGAGYGRTYRVVGGRDFTEEDDFDPYDDGPAGFHGTHVAGIVGSDHAVYTGVAPGVDIVALRVFNDQGVSDFAWVERALSWVHQNRNSFEHPITTVNLSCGVFYNGDAIPSWAMFEDELAQLERDGMFISVSAGNDFVDFDAPGLSYPAVSPHVVPVASVGDDGKISDFSQRNGRVLAAPGERITSTIPDYLFSFDGVVDDFASASGTSMAAPYVAGASVLVRQALQFNGYTDVTQNTIYDLLRDTADRVYDAQTQQSYHRIDLQSALDTIMPPDDFGSTLSSARQLGTVSAGMTLTGLIGRLDDVDFFRFTSDVTGTATVSATTSNALEPQWQLVGAQGEADGDSLSFDVVAGRTYTVGIGTENGIGRYELDVEIAESVTDWGTVGFTRLVGQQVHGEAWYRLTAERVGVVVVEAAFSNAAGNIDLELYDRAGHLVAVAASSDDGERLHTTASVGDTFLVRAVGTNTNVEYRVTNVATAGKAVATVLVEDFTSDGFADVLVYKTNGTWWLTATRATGANREYWGRWSTTGACSDVMAGDFDNDGDLDVVGRTQLGEWWIALNTGSCFESRVWGRWSERVRWQEVDARDFDSDGDLDIVGRTNWGEWWVAVNTGQGFVNRFWGRGSPEMTTSNVAALDVDSADAADLAGQTPGGEDTLAPDTGTGVADEPSGRRSSPLWQPHPVPVDFGSDSSPGIVGRLQFGQSRIDQGCVARMANQHSATWTCWPDIARADMAHLAEENRFAADAFATTADWGVWPDIASSVSRDALGTMHHPVSWPTLADGLFSRYGP
jgi:hypothetical protein